MISLANSYKKTCWFVMRYIRSRKNSYSSVFFCVSLTEVKVLNNLFYANSYKRTCWFLKGKSRSRKKNSHPFAFFCYLEVKALNDLSYELKHKKTSRFLKSNDRSIRTHITSFWVLEIIVCIPITKHQRDSWKLTEILVVIITFSDT